MLAERLPVYLVSPPGETAWARKANFPVRPHVGSTRPSGHKRAREDDITPSPCEPVMADTVVPAPVPSAPAAGGANGTDKRMRGPSTGAASMGWSGAALGLNLPVPGAMGGFAVVGKIYDEEIIKGLRVNELVEVVGILQDAVKVEGDGMFADEMRARNPSVVRRIHVVKMRKVGEDEANPALMALGREIGGVKAELRSSIGRVREGCISWFANGLGGDRLAAEYLLMGVLGRPAVRTGGVVLGGLCVNLVLAEGMEITGLMEALESVCVRVVRVGVDVGSLNTREVYPRKDYETNRVKAGVLQLAAGTVAVGDETGLRDGRLSERGVKNVKALKKVIQSGMMPIDFKYYEAEMPVDCTVVMVSKGGKSIIGGDVVVKVQKQEGWKPVAADESELEKLRVALAVLREDGGKFEIEEGVSGMVENEWVTVRRNGGGGEEVLQGWLKVGRACARSWGEAGLGRERWSYVSALEKNRTSRLSN